MEQAQTAGTRMRAALRGQGRYVLLAGIIAGEFLLFGVAAPYFLTVGNLFNILRQVSEIGMISIPLTFLLLSGHMDLSVGSIVGVCGVSTGMILRAGGSIPLALLAGIAAGTAVGFLNGLIVGKLKIQAVVVTIGTQVLFRGLCYILPSGRAVSGSPAAFFTLGTGDVLGVPISVIVLLVMYAAAWLVLEKSWFGRYVLAIGNNQNTARYSGIRVDRMKIALFTLCGALTAVASAFLISRLSSAEATLGSGYELDIITAALIGGIDINGGSGKLQGTFLGILIIGILRNGLNMMGLSVIYQSIILGALLLAAVAGLGGKRAKP